MSIWGKLAGAAAGLALGGPIGGLLGALAGHLMVDRGTGTAGKDVSANQVAFTVGVIALGAKMAKADGVVTRDEVRAFREVFKVPESEMHNVARLFDLAKQDVAGYEAYARQLAGMFGQHNRQLLQDVLEGLFHIATADGVVHPDEDVFLYNVARLFGFTEAEFQYIRARHVQDAKASPYDVLEVSPDISDEALKRHYRKLVMENHPDKLVSRGVPQEFVEIATRKLAAINQAYDEIRKERGL